MNWSAMLALALLMGCSGERESKVDTGGTTSPTAPTPMVSPSAAVSSARLTGRVSPLNSSVSGLNIRVTDYGTVIDLPADALFEFDKADLTPSAAEQLAKSAEVIRKAPPGTIKVVGHTDSKGDDAYNQSLSEARARTVAGWFGQQVGVRQRTFAVNGMGEKSPIAPNETLTGKDDPSGRARNRRVEVVLPSDKAASQ